MTRTKLTVKRIHCLPLWLLNRRQNLFKIKMILAERKRVDIKKNGDIVKKITVRQKTKYFNDRWARTF